MALKPRLRRAIASLFRVLQEQQNKENSKSRKYVHNAMALNPRRRRAIADFYNLILKIKIYQNYLK